MEKSREWSDPFLINLGRSDIFVHPYYLYDGSDPVAEIDASGNVQALNTFGANGLVSRHTTGLNGATNASVFYTFDERGNVAQPK